MKGLNAPAFFSIQRKEYVYLTKPNPGRHSLERSISLELLARKLNLAGTKRDIKKIIENGMILINGKVIREIKYPIGLNDTVEVAKKYYRYHLPMMSTTRREKIAIDDFHRINKTNQRISLSLMGDSKGK